MIANQSMILKSMSFRKKKESKLEKTIQLFKSLKLDTFNIQPIHYLMKTNSPDYLEKTNQLIESINSINMEKNNKLINYNEMSKKLLTAYYISGYGEKFNMDDGLINSAKLVVYSINQYLCTGMVTDNLIGRLNSYFLVCNDISFKKSKKNDGFFGGSTLGNLVVLFNKEITSRQINKLKLTDLIPIDINLRYLFCQLCELNPCVATELFLKNYSALNDSSIIHNFWEKIEEISGKEKGVYYLIFSFIKLQMIKHTHDPELRVTIYLLDSINIEYNNNDALVKFTDELILHSTKLNITNVVGSTIFEKFENLCLMLTIS
jgi:hypothetical protein